MPDNWCSKNRTVTVTRDLALSPFTPAPSSIKWECVTSALSATQSCWERQGFETRFGMVVTLQLGVDTWVALQRAGIR